MPVTSQARWQKSIASFLLLASTWMSLVAENSTRSHRPPSLNDDSTSKQRWTVSQGDAGVPHDREVNQDGEVGPSDVVVAIVTASPVMVERLAVLWEAWLHQTFLPNVVIITDAESEAAVEQLHRELGIPPQKFVQTDCPASKEGLVCKTARSLEISMSRYPDAEFFMRVMDDTMILDDHLLDTFRRHRSDAPTCLGDMLELPELDLSFPQGGGGWVVNRRAADILVAHLDEYRGIQSTSGRTWLTPTFQADKSFVDDIFWGIFLTMHRVVLVRPEGWSALPIDVRGGVYGCDQLYMPLEGGGHIDVPIGKTDAGVVVHGRYHCRQTTSRMAVVHMGTIFNYPRSWLSHGAEVVATVRSLEQETEGQYRFTLDHHSKEFWRVCVDRRERDDRGYRPMSEERQQQIRDGVHTTALVIFAADDRVFELSVGLCDDSESLAESFINHSGISYSLTRVAGWLDQVRDELRLHHPPSLVRVQRGGGLPDGILTANVGDDTRQIAWEACTEVDPGVGGKALCASRLSAALDANFPPALTYSALCDRGGWKEIT